MKSEVKFKQNTSLCKSLISDIMSCEATTSVHMVRPIDVWLAVYAKCIYFSHTEYLLSNVTTNLR